MPIDRHHVSDGQIFRLLVYSSQKWMLVVCYLMKQNCYFQRGVAECRHAATPLSSYNINTTLQGFQKRYSTLFYLKGLKRYQQKCKWKVRFTKESGVNSLFSFILLRKETHKLTVPENECEAFAVLWSKTAIFWGAWQNIDMQPHL